MILQPLIDEHIDSKLKLSAKWKAHPQCEHTCLNICDIVSCVFIDDDDVDDVDDDDDCSYKDFSDLLSAVLAWFDAEKQSEIQLAWPPVEREANPALTLASLDPSKKRTGPAVVAPTSTKKK